MLFQTLDRFLDEAFISGGKFWFGQGKSSFREFPLSFPFCFSALNLWPARQYQLSSLCTGLINNGSGGSCFSSLRGDNHALMGIFLCPFPVFPNGLCIRQFAISSWAIGSSVSPEGLFWAQFRQRS